MGLHEAILPHRSKHLWGQLTLAAPAAGTDGGAESLERLMFLLMVRAPDYTDGLITLLYSLPRSPILGMYDVKGLGFTRSRFRV